ncbi:MAG: VOC family protein [Verrucomicrobia bacterium]|nr:VOC family protein [Verrucomicrobiota bacterium]
MSSQYPGQALTGHHHVTIGVGDPQEDFDFHTKVLGLKCVKRTLFYDGATPVYHFYYGNDSGEVSTLVTTFPMAHTGVKATEGSGQCSYVSLSVPTDSLGFWKEHLGSHDLEVAETERFGERCLDFRSPHNIRYSIVGIDGDTRSPHHGGPVPDENMIRGTHTFGVSSRDMEFMSEFLEVAWGSRKVGEDGNLIRYEMGAGGTGTYVDFEHEPDRKAGSWIVGEGAIHHVAFNCPTHDQQNQIKFFVEGLGYTDFSDVKDRGYFDSIYVRTPSGALFEAAVSHDPAFLCNEPYETLGTQLMMSPQVEQNKEEVLNVIGRLRD